MFSPNEYQLLDFGNGRRLERFGPLCLDRPCPAAELVQRGDPGLWPEADARFERAEGQEGRWIDRRPLPGRWTIGHGRVRFELKRTEVGHLGLFPEQAACWDWIASQLVTPSSSERLRVLNLFAYTGGSTLAAADAGAEVTHVDAARNVVAWARRNAELSGLSDAPIRWIAEDVLKYVNREWKRGRRYDAVILDPPTYGHGPKGEVWQFDKDLPGLLEICMKLTAPNRRFILLTCHTPQFGAERLASIFHETLGSRDCGTIEAHELFLHAATGQELPSGVVVRWTAENQG